jgi:hypothetical protein
MRAGFGLLACCFMAAAAFAGGDECAQAAKGGKECKAACSAGGCSEKTLAAAGVPAMRVVVGKEEFKCPMEAQEAIKKNNGQAVYYVADVKYTDMAEAGKAYARELDKYLADTMSVKYSVGGQCVSCPTSAGEMARKSGKPVHYRLASFEFADRAKADAALAEAKKAVETVKVEWKVGDKTYTCPQEAEAASKTCGKAVEYAVAGQCCHCPIQADVVTAMTKIRVALGAIEKATQG